MNKINLEFRLERIENLLLSNKKVLTFDEACLYTGISHSYMYKLTSTNRIPFSKPSGKIIFFDKEKLDNWLLSKHQTPRPNIEDKALSYVLKNKK